MKTLSLAAAFLSFALATNPGVSAESGSLQQCQSIKDSIQRYTDKRRRGGSSAQMSGWQKKRNHYNRLYSRYDCKRHRRNLK
ncbi:MAG: hypothetical protein V7707_08750 [Motiliproteus sp.]